MSYMNNINYPSKKFTFALAHRLDKCDKCYARFLVARRVSVVGLMSGGMKPLARCQRGGCNYLLCLG